jgi:hypothetical protein
MVEEQLLSNGWLKEPHAENNVFPHHKGFSCYFVLFLPSINFTILPVMWMKHVD